MSLKNNLRKYPKTQLLHCRQVDFSRQPAGSLPLRQRWARFQSLILLAQVRRVASSCPFFPRAAPGAAYSRELFSSSSCQSLDVPACCNRDDTPIPNGSPLDTLTITLTHLESNPFLEFGCKYSRASASSSIVDFCVTSIFLSISWNHRGKSRFRKKKRIYLESWVHFGSAQRDQQKRTLW